jgi:hypothetical protein
MSDTSWPSTRGLSVFNALSCAGKDMSADGILEYLRAVWDPKMGAEYVTDGIAFLRENDMVRIDGETVRLKERGPNGKGRIVVRADDDRALRVLPHWSP